LPIFLYSSRIDASTRALYKFHLDPKNVARIQPPGFEVTEVQVPAEAKVGAEIKLTLRVLGRYTQEWRVVWEELKPPSGGPMHGRVVDRAISSPFPAFRHEHLFTEDGIGTRLTDRIVFQPPSGWKGWLALPFIYLQLYFVFIWRHYRTGKLLKT
jgi:ligand-binding SRPBCC domain-containing protein